MQLRIVNSILLCVLLLPAVSFADSAGIVSELQHDWAVANYRLTGGAQKNAYEALIERADAAVAQNLQSADVLIWNGIIKSAYAGVKGGLGALSLAKQAKKSLEAAIRIDAMALNGSAYTSLGTLYSKVPGRPLGFGSDKKAVQLLKLALEINPDGIDTNYFYADYLLSNKEFEQAEQYLLKAQMAAPRQDRPIADAGRQHEILVALAQVRSKLKRTDS